MVQAIDVLHAEPAAPVGLELHHVAVVGHHTENSSIRSAGRVYIGRVEVAEHVR